MLQWVLACSALQLERRGVQLQEEAQEEAFSCLSCVAVGNSFGELARGCCWRLGGCGQGQVVNMWNPQ